MEPAQALPKVLKALKARGHATVAGAPAGARFHQTVTLDVRNPLIIRAYTASESFNPKFLDVGVRYGADCGPVLAFTFIDEGGCVLGSVAYSEIVEVYRWPAKRSALPSSPSNAFWTGAGQGCSRLWTP